MSESAERVSNRADEAVEALHEPDESLVRLAAALPNAVAMLRGERLVWCNDRLQEMTGRDRRRLLGARLGELFKDTGSGLPDVTRPRAVECGLQRPDGELRTAVCRPAWNDDRGSCWVIEDSTHVRMLETELLSMSQQLHRANREVESQRERLRNEHAEREELLTIVSHELRTPVTVIRGYNRLLLSEEVGSLTPEQRRFLEESNKGCEKLNAFIGNLLEASRQAAGDEILEIQHSPLGPLIESVVASLRPLVDEHEIHLAVDLDPDAGPVRFDPMRVEQILNNLVVNAIKYAPDGGRIEIGLRGLPRVKGQRSFVQVSVSDDGPGVAPEDVERIFEPYVRAGEESKAGGLGLGLAICRRLVEVHGGVIGVSPRPGGGSCFAFTLPTSENVSENPPILSAGRLDDGAGEES